MSSIVYLNGEFLPADKACIPVLDRGFIFGDGVYEVIPAYGGNLFRLHEHLKRLDNSLRSIRIPDPLSHAQWENILGELINRNEGQDQSVYLQVTCGVAKRDHAIPAGIAPTVFAMSNPLVAPSDTDISRGISVITSEDYRWKNCHIKATSLLANILLRQQAIDSDSVEAILIRDGMATEGAASNLFIVLNGKIVTPPNSNFLLPGITRDLVLELVAASSMDYAEADISESDLRDAQEIWITSSQKEVMPVTRLDGKVVGDGKPGPVWRRVHGLYQDYKRQLRSGEKR